VTALRTLREMADSVDEQPQSAFDGLDETPAAEASPHESRRVAWLKPKGPRQLEKARALLNTRLWSEFLALTGTTNLLGLDMGVLGCAGAGRICNRSMRTSLPEPATARSGIPSLTG